MGQILPPLRAGKLGETIQRMNWQFGRGSVVKVSRKEGIATVRYGFGLEITEQVKFTVTGNKVRFRGVTRTIGYKNRY